MCAVWLTYLVDCRYMNYARYRSMYPRMSFMLKGHNCPCSRMSRFVSQDAAFLQGHHIQFTLYSIHSEVSGIASSLFPSVWCSLPGLPYVWHFIALISMRLAVHRPDFHVSCVHYLVFHVSSISTPRLPCIRFGIDQFWRSLTSLHCARLRAHSACLHPPASLPGVFNELC